MSQIRVTDVTLRDGSHAMQHAFTVQQVRDVVTALDAAGSQRYRSLSRGRSGG